jgi:hypothetical protein
MCLILNDYRDTDVRIYEYKSTVNGITTQILLSVCVILVFTEYLSDQFVTVHKKYSKIPPSSSIPFATRM